MNKNDSGFEALCKALEQVAGFKMTTPANFERLSEMIFQWQHVKVSTSTLKRLWGYTQQTVMPHRSTLDVLAGFVGYKDYTAFLDRKEEMEYTQSDVALVDALKAEDLQVGERLHISWLPNRFCIVEHQGNGHFLVLKAENAKIHDGDQFSCHLMINHEPLTVDLMRDKGRSTMVYTAGKKDGVTIRRL
jgi:hypothetical protein